MRFRVTQTHYGAAAGVITGLVIYLVQHYGFSDGPVPEPIQAAVYLIVPTVVTAATAYFTRQEDKQPIPPQTPPV